ncbi:hypothetical protein [Clostridium intestinale]|uniref:SMI1/KNR4 family protein n=1 Tax=Clostridium intestinale TaxID=36845 RepID=A0A7D6VSK7_9CLOT|nr:hypothetical protein [Clostridium intestinale]QLY81836.1 hypothetical protein HZF06_09700 [Clostridium intestinale]
MNIRDFNLLEPNKVLIHWEKVEEELGFKICDDVKAFFTRIAGGYIREIVYFKEDSFFKKTGIHKYDHWISFNECEGKVEISLNTPKSENNIEKFIINAFREWTGGNSFGHRALLGDFEFKIGSVLILLNNDSCQVEWMDCEYGYFDVYDENPNGVIANSLQEFLDKCADNRVEV